MIPCDCQGQVLTARAARVQGIVRRIRTTSDEQLRRSAALIVAELDYVADDLALRLVAATPEQLERIELLIEAYEDNALDVALGGSISWADAALDENYCDEMEAALSFDEATRQLAEEAEAAGDGPDAFPYSHPSPLGAPTDRGLAPMATALRQAH